MGAEWLHQRKETRALHRGPSWRERYERAQAELDEIRHKEAAAAAAADVVELAAMWLRNQHDNTFRVFANAVRLAVMDTELRRLLEARDVYFTAAELKDWPTVTGAKQSDQLFETSTRNCVDKRIRAIWAERKDQLTLVNPDGLICWLPLIMRRLLWSPVYEKILTGDKKLDARNSGGRN